MAWTTAQNVINAWIGDDDPTDTALIATWIDKAEREIRFKVPGIQARITAAEVDLLENAIDVVTAMVIRKFNNPQGIRTANTATGPFSESRTFGGDDPGELVMLANELAKLTANASDRRAFGVNLIPTTSPFYVAPVTS
ncbi:Gp19/Gp15/Gp42 family protein [Cryobacterium sp. Y57]|uniref:Gp19/Gp15/Gp42 family protein n=1 Tax=Cryobacterium sp. Y57 TaxID=2048287 RepID=UPI000CE2B69E|nr:Gp19/Gp15/Gp42 family protein [Cryobacterium sp. Y57]